MLAPVGRQFNRLTVLGPDPNRPRYWLCECSCTKVVKSIRDFQVTSGRTKSCGCWKNEHLVAFNFRHGRSQNGDPVFRAWCNLKDRCLNPNHPRYADYGGRGITIYPPWVDDFLAFADHVGPRPSPRHTLDRIDNDKGYEPGNVRWATRSQQNQNQRSPKRKYKLPRGVHPKTGNKSRPFCSLISIHGRQVYLGAFETVEGAREAYLTALAELNRP